MDFFVQGVGKPQTGDAEKGKDEEIQSILTVEL